MYLGEEPLLKVADQEVDSMTVCTHSCLYKLCCNFTTDSCMLKVVCLCLYSRNHLLTFTASYT